MALRALHYNDRSAQAAAQAPKHTPAHPLCAVDGVEVLIVDTPWLAPLLMHICEIVFIGGMHFSGEQNYMVVAQAAVASCAVIASSSVMAHVQLAQELNNAAVNAAEDAAHAVRTAGAAPLLATAAGMPCCDSACALRARAQRSPPPRTAGVDTEAMTPWNTAMHSSHTPRSPGPPEREPLSPVAGAHAADLHADSAMLLHDAADSPTAAVAASGARPRTVSRQIIFSQESVSIADSIGGGSPLAGELDGAFNDSIRVARRSALETEAGEGHGAGALSLEQDEVLSTGCSTPVLGHSPTAAGGRNSSELLSPSGLARQLARAASPRATLTPQRPSTVRCPLAPAVLWAFGLPMRCSVAAVSGPLCMCMCRESVRK